MPENQGTPVHFTGLLITFAYQITGIKFNLQPSSPRNLLLLGLTLKPPACLPGAGFVPDLNWDMFRDDFYLIELDLQLQRGRDHLI